MTFHLEYRDKATYSCEKFDDLNLTLFSPRGIRRIEFNHVAVYLPIDEMSIAHRLRRSWRIDERLTKDHYCLMTNKRRIFFFPDGKVAVMVESGQKDALFREFALTMEEQEYLMFSSPKDQLQLGKEAAATNLGK